jgi:hypothetical protein
VAGSCECGDEPSGSGATELVTEPDVLQKRRCLYFCTYKHTNGLERKLNIERFTS